MLEDLKGRGVKTIDLWVSDGNQAMLNAITKQFPDSARQRCVVHKMDNVLSYVPTKQQEQLKAELKALFYQKDRQVADQAVAAFIQKYQQIYPTAIACLQRDLEACLTFYAFPKEHWKTIRTNNVSERLLGEVKRRSHKMAAAFRTEGSCVLLFYAVIRSLKFNKLTMSAPATKQPDAGISTTVDKLPPRYAYVKINQHLPKFFHRFFPVTRTVKIQTLPVAIKQTSIKALTKIKEYYAQNYMKPEIDLADQMLLPSPVTQDKDKPPPSWSP